MIFGRLSRFWNQLSRALAILGIILRHILADFLSRSRLGKWILVPKRRRELQKYTTPNRIRMALEELGPTFIKFGQIMADRPDLVSDVVRRELKRLQDKAIPMDDALGIRLIEEQIRVPLEEIFGYVQHKHIASASIGQVYAAQLRSGENVVIKIQRPGIEGKIKLDLYLLHFLAKRVQKRYPDLLALDIQSLVDEFAQTILLELNYLNETSNLLRFQEMFKDEPTVYIPTVYTEYCTRKLIVMERIEGLRPDKPEGLREAGLDPTEVAKNGANAVCEMVFRHGFFHADPHAGNLFIREKNQVCFIDFGMVGTLKPAHMQFLAHFSLGLARWDAKSLSRSLIELCGRKFFPEAEELEFEIEKILKRYSLASGKLMDVAQVLNECMTIIGKYGLKIPGSIFLLAKALASMQKFAFALDPKLSITDTLTPYARGLVMKKYSIRKMAGNLYDTLSDYATLFKELPTEINEILYKMKEGKLVLEVNLQDSQKAGSFLQSFGSRLLTVILISSFVIGASLYAIWGPDRNLAEDYRLVLEVGGIFLILYLLVKRR